MGHLDETRLPGIGTRVEFVTEEGRRMGVVQHYTGRREIFVCPLDDPDMTDVALNLTEDDAHSLIDALDVVRITEGAGQRTYQVEGLVFEWLDIDTDSPSAGRSIGDLRIRTRTGASVVAVLRSSGSVPAPEPDFVIEADDTVMVAGTPEGIDQVRELLRSG